MAVILASASPRRRALMEQLGIEFECCVSNYVEVLDVSMAPDVLVVQLAMGKALDVAQDRFDDVIIGADTFVVFENECLGKVESEAEARAILERIAGQTVLVYTGLAVVSGDGCFAETVITPCNIKAMNPSALDAYIASGVYEDKAGAVAIDIVDSVDGPVDAVLGLPVELLRCALTGLGVSTTPT